MAANDNLGILMSSGFDAFTNLWDISISLPGSKDPTVFKEISIRTSDFTPPKVSVETYTLKYKGTHLERLNASLEYKDKRELNLTFRLDGQFELLKELQEWKNLYYNASNGGNIKFGLYSSSATESYGKITVTAYRTINGDTGYELQDLVDPGSGLGTDRVDPKWVFKQVCLLDVDVEPFSRDKSDALLVKCMFIYGAIEEPYTTT
jgi:hypothetical protein